MNFASMSPSDLTPLFCGSGLQKYDLFPNWQALFSIIFSNVYINLIINKIKIFKQENNSSKNEKLIKN